MWHKRTVVVEGRVWRLVITIFALILLGIATAGLWAGLTAVTPRSELQEIQGRVTYLKTWWRENPESGRRGVVANLAGYDKTVTFIEPASEFDAVAAGLRGDGSGAYVTLLVEEREEEAEIWEGQANGTMFLNYETKAQWKKSNGTWGLVVGLVFLAAGSPVYLLAVRGRVSYPVWTN